MTDTPNGYFPAVTQERNGPQLNEIERGGWKNFQPWDNIPVCAMANPFQSTTIEHDQIWRNCRNGEAARKRAMGY